MTCSWTLPGLVVGDGLGVGVSGDELGDGGAVPASRTRITALVKSLGVVFFRSGGDGGQGGAAAGAGAVVGLEHVGQAAQGGLGEVASFAVLPLLVLLQQDGADQAGDGVAVGEDLGRRLLGAGSRGPSRSMGLLRPDLGPVLAGEGSWRRLLGPARRPSASERF